MKVVRGIIGATLALSVLAGCNMLENVNSEGRTVVISDDVALKSVIDDAKVAVSKPEQMNLQEKITYAELLSINQNELLFVKDKTLYQSDLSNSKANLIEKISVKELSQNGKKVLSLSDKIVTILDLETLIMNEVYIDSRNIGDIVFADPTGQYISYYDFETYQYVVTHVETLEKTVLDFNELFDQPTNYSFGPGIVKDNHLYLPIHFEKDGLAIYKFSFNNKMEKILTFKHENDHIGNFEFLSDNLIVFNGVYNEDPGIFFYDITTQQINKVVSGGNDSEGTWTPSFSISPDGTSMLFNTVVRDGEKYLDNVYMAKIEQNALSKSVRVIENAQLPAVISILAHWNHDSSSFYIPRSSKAITGFSEENIDYISIFELDKINE